jgi:hypothetical protein
MWLRGRVLCQTPMQVEDVSMLSLTIPICSLEVALTTPPQTSKYAGVCSLRTGNTTGTPPLTAFVPSVFAFSLTHSFSPPFASFQLMIVAPKSSTSMLSPVGSTAETRLLECEIVTCACGARPGVAESADGFFGRSTILT